MKRIALVGDYNPEVVAHQGIECSMRLAAADDSTLEWSWLHTVALHEPARQLAGFGGIWVVPASPYASEAGALGAIRYAREKGIPFLGTCGGFQHAVLEYARNVLRLESAAHAETDPHAEYQVISPLQCSLVEKRGRIRLVEGTRLRAIYGEDQGDEGYHCSYGFNRAYEGRFTGGQLRISARDDEGEVRALELEGHPFFVATLFQPERRGLTGALHPIVFAFLQEVGVPPRAAIS